METNNKSEALIDAIEVPDTLSEHHVNFARKLVKAQMTEGHTVLGFCTANNMSTKTYYEYMENPALKHYMGQIQDVIIPSDEKLAYEQLKKHLLKIPYKANPTPKEIELFTDTFSYVIEADKRQRMAELGLNDSSISSSGKSVEERKAKLLSRLKGSN
ncbi:hypothetical protein ACFW35_18325 [Fictibacillus sp. NPDC058756]|uniref:hypothetical protein n=1 Tax=Fictibacillus sp. NPDC058756 TaxID=3346625 RepID=UPI003695F584